MKRVQRWRGRRFGPTFAVAHGFAMASRDTRAFNAAGLTVIDPWTAAC
ncbi:hypothetical protein DF3PA_10021 [Candidatus Defluviicoccus seviourii]|uniref:Uncharacterized protein n=2 Tax=root TaxID=1 RepID=A0A564W8Y4_9PROT|nr:hypothetical protein DF3PB_440013 [uncultured Defluviicoccus sp.]VUX44896.1 hypothetical protein DF3PA_10021 [Candidatus Defluviicoccus seviourii]